jgi:hypothetical protein
VQRWAAQWVARTAELSVGHLAAERAAKWVDVMVGKWAASTAALTAARRVALTVATSAVLTVV